MCNRQKPITVSEINDLRTIMQNRIARVKWLTEAAKTASKADCKWIAKELKEHKAWIKNTELQIKSYYALKSA